MEGNTQAAGLSEVMSTIITGGKNRVALTDGSDVIIKVCNGAALPTLLAFAAKLSSDLGLSLKDPEGVKDKLLSKVDDIGFILKLISEYADDVYGLIAAMSSLETAAAVKALPIDDIIAVAVEVVAVNRDFFMTRVLPALKGGRR